MIDIPHMTEAEKLNYCVVGIEALIISQDTLMAAILQLQAAMMVLVAGLDEKERGRIDDLYDTLVEREQQHQTNGS